jgi:hypothetical protein
MGGLSVFSTALALVRGFEDDGAPHSLSPDGLTVVGRNRPSDEMAAAQRAFLGAPEAFHEAAGDQRKQLAPYRALRAVVKAEGIAREVLVLRVRDLARYPVPFTVRFTHLAGAAAGDQRWPARAAAFSTGRAGFGALVAAKVPAFSPSELEAAALAVEMGRAGARDMARWIEAKTGRDWALDVRLARVSEMPAYREGMKPALVLGELFDALGCEIGSVELQEKNEAKEGSPP